MVISMAKKKKKAASVSWIGQFQTVKLPFDLKKGKKKLKKLFG